MLYDSYVKAFNESDIDLLLSIHHEEFEATFHSTGKVMTKADMQAADTIAWMKSMSTDKAAAFMRMTTFWSYISS